MRDTVYSALIERAALDPFRARGNGPKFVVVLDTDALLSSIDNHCRTGRPARILRMAESSHSYLFAEDHVYGEMYAGFAKIAAAGGTPVDDMRRVFEDEYLAHIRWVTVEADHVLDDRVALVTDVTDMPTAQLASLIGPCLVLSEDKSLRRPGFAPDNWRAAAGAGVNVVDGYGTVQVVSAAAVLPPYGLVRGGIKLGGAVGVPWWGSLVVMAAGGYWLLSSPERRQSITRWAAPLLDTVVGILAEAQQRQESGTRDLRPAMFQPVTRPGLTQQVATVLARSRERLLASEIHEQIVVQHSGWEAPRVSDIRRVLHARSEFIGPVDYRWQLGRVAAPLRPGRQ